MVTRSHEFELSTFPLIILAAGKSSRFGYPKGLAPLADGTLWLQHQIESAENIGIRSIILVLGPDHDSYKETLSGLNSRFSHPTNRSLRSNYGGSTQKTLKVLINSKPESGPWASLELAISWLIKENNEGFPGFFLLPIDVPLALPQVWHSLIKNLLPQTGAAVPRYQEKGGHPVLLSSQLAKRILAETKRYNRLDLFLKDQIPGIVSKVSVDDYRVGLNINTQEDWNIYKQGLTP